MLQRLILSLFILFPLTLNAKSWYSNVDTKLEIGMYLPSITGTISNNYTTSNFYDDYNYEKTRASYFALTVVPKYNYVPNININYLNMKDNQDVNLTKSVVVADETFNSYTSTLLDYSIVNMTIYHDFKRKGNMLSFLGKNFYSGDIQFDVGVNAKLIQWNFEIVDRTTDKSPSWINARILIPLPYIGVTYYLYDLSAYASISTLSFSEAKATHYNVGIDYRLIDRLYVSGGYLYERFKALEKEDTVKFTTQGYKFSFKYIF